MGRAVFLLSLAAFASAASLRATDPLLPLIAAEYGVTVGTAAAAVTAFALSYGLLQILYGPLGDRYGRYRTIAAAAFVSAFGSAACAAAPSMELLVAARFASGATIGAFIPLALAWIGDTVAYEKRQPLLARFLVGQMAGVAFGTAAAGWLGQHFGWRSIFLALAALLLVIALLLLLEIRANPLAGRGGERVAAAETDRRLKDEIATHRPQVLLLLHGINDVNNGATSRTVADALRDHIRTARDRGVQYVFLSTLLPVAPDVCTFPDPGDPRCRALDTPPGQPEEVNQQIRSMVGSTGAHLVDPYDELVAKRREYIDTDGLHTRPAGNRALATAFWDRIVAVIPARQLLGDSR